METENLTKTDEKKIKDREYQKHYREKHKDKINQFWKKYYETHKDEIDEKNKKYSLNHKKQILESNKKYRESHKEKLSKYAKKYRQTHKEKLKQKTFEWKYGITPQQFNFMLKTQNNKCAICGQEFGKNRNNMPNLCFNHYDGKVIGLVCYRDNLAYGTYSNLIRYKDIIDDYMSRIPYNIFYVKEHIKFNKQCREMIEKEQDYKCAICGCDLGYKGELSYDHETGFVKGVLCHTCNAGLSDYFKMLKMKDKIEELEKQYEMI